MRLPRRFLLIPMLMAGLGDTAAAGQPPAPPPNPAKLGMPKAGQPGRFEPVPTPPGGRPRLMMPDEPREMMRRYVPPEDLMPDVRWWLDPPERPKDKPIDPKLLKELMEKVPKDEKADPKQIEQFLQENPQFKNPEFLKQLEGMSKSKTFPQNLEGKLEPGVTPPNVENKEAYEENLKQVIESGQQPHSPEGGPKSTPKTGDGTTTPSDPPKLPEGEQQGNPADNEWVKWMQKNFGETEAGKSAVKDLMSALEKKDSQSMFGNIPEFQSGGWKDFDNWGKSNVGEIWKMKPPEMGNSKLTPPKLGGGGSGGGSSVGSGGGGGGLGGGGGGLGGGGASALAIIAGIVGAIFLAVLLFRKWKVRQAGKAAAIVPHRNGIDFDSIRTREQLVNAFDHVSLDQIGEDARSWNHRVIADQIAETRPAQAEPADQLAGLYERARYAPLDEDLTTNEFSDARRDLRVIAGVA